MKTTMPIKFCIVPLLCFVFNLSAQNKSAVKSFIWAMRLPNDMDRGPMQVGIGGTYYFERETIADKHYANLHISFTKMNFLGNGIPAYKYNGTVYLANEMNTTDGLGNIGFDKLQITSLAMKVQVIAAQPNIGGSNAFVLVQSSLGTVHHAAEIVKETNLDHIDLMWAGSFLTDINWNNSSELENRIRNLVKSQQNKDEYKNVIQQADNAYARNNLTEAKTLYEKAQNLSPKENYPKTQLSKIDNALSEKEKQELASRKEQDTKTTTISKTEDTTSNNQLVINRPRQPTAEQIKEDKNREINAKVAAQMAEIKQRQEQAKQIETDLVNKANNLSQSFSQGNRASASVQAMQEASLSDKIFNSIEELDQEYSRQMQIIKQESSNYASAKTASVSSYIDANSNSGSQYDAAINSSMKAIGGLFSQIKANKEEKENKERLRAEREAQLALIENKRKAVIFNMRQKMLELFPDGKLPLESNNVKQTQVYVFAYLTNKNALVNVENTKMTVSNIIAIDKLDDGSFPYKSALINNLKKFGTDTVYISGYYLNATDAKKMLDSFIVLASKSNLQLDRFSYNVDTPKKSNTITSSNGDFWETGSKKNTEPNKKPETKKGGDFWND